MRSWYSLSIFNFNKNYNHIYVNTRYVGDKHIMVIPIEQSHKLKSKNGNGLSKSGFKSINFTLKIIQKKNIQISE